MFETLYLFTLDSYLGMMNYLLLGIHGPKIQSVWLAIGLWVLVNCSVNFIGHRDFLLLVTFPLK